MPRASVLVIVLVVVATFAGMLYFHTTRPVGVGVASVLEPTNAAASSSTQRTLAGAPENMEHEPATTQSVSTDFVSTGPAPTGSASTDSVSRWVEDTKSLDAKTRGAAIAALANAPKAYALPALKQVLKTGEPQTDRPIALQSLHALALNDGDGDGQIRDTIRGAIYHGDDEATNQTAQALLEDIEAEFAQRAQARN